jgi:hypothetical protein
MGRREVLSYDLRGKDIDHKKAAKREILSLILLS